VHAGEQASLYETVTADPPVPDTFTIANPSGEVDNAALTAVNAAAVQRAALETAQHAGAVAGEEES